MAVTVQETTNSRGGSDEALSREYDVFGTEDEVTALTAAINAAPSALGSLKYSGTSIEEINRDDQRGGHYRCKVNFATGQNVTPEPDQSEFRFSFQAPSAQIYQSLATINSYGTDPPDFDGCINVVNDGGKRRVEGFNLAPPPETFFYKYYPAPAMLTSSYFLTVESLVGQVNSVAFKGRPAGSLMLVRSSGGYTAGQVAPIEFGFSYVANATNIPIGGSITATTKDGHDLLWPYYADDKDDTAKTLIKKPVAAYVERIRYRDDFSKLGF